MPDDYSLGQTDKVMKRMQELLTEIDGIEKFMCVVGLNGATRTKSPDTGALFVKMDPKLERMRCGQDMLNMMGAISKKLYEELPEASTFILPRLPLEVSVSAATSAYRCRTGWGSARAPSKSTPILWRKRQPSPSLS